MMSTFLLGRLKTCPLDIANPDEVNGLCERLSKGLQTQDRDHEIIARLLEISLVVHSVNGVKENVVDLGSDAACMHVLHCSKTDGAGVAQGHFDLLLPATEKFQNLCLLRTRCQFHMESAYVAVSWLQLFFTDGRTWRIVHFPSSGDG